MAEFIQEIKERMLPEYEMMKKFEICSESQLKECMRQRENFQTKITQSEKSMRDFADYIIFERKVHKWITEKERIIGPKLKTLKTMIVTRICKLYRDGLRHFPHEERFWQNFIQFSKKSVPHEVSGIYEKMLMYHGDEPEVWCDAALWVYEYTVDMTRVKEIFLRALQRHCTSEVVNKTFFDILLLEAAKMNSERKYDDNTLSEQDVALERVVLVYKNSKLNVSNIEYYINLLKRCEEDKFKDISAPIQKIILDDIMQSFPRNEMLWDVLAQRELNGFNMCDLDAIPYISVYKNKARESTASHTKLLLKQIEILNEHENFDNNDSALEQEHEHSIETQDNDIKPTRTQSVWKFRTLKHRIEICVKVYQTAVKTLNTPTMWSLYINAMLKLNQDMSTQANLKRKSLAAAFKEGHTAGCMSVDHYTTFVRMLLESKNSLKLTDTILSEAVKKQNSVKLYELWLGAFIEVNDMKKSEEIFEQAKKSLGFDALPLWRLMVCFYKTRYECDGCTKKLLELYKDACRQVNQKFGILRAEYIDFCMSISSIVEARALYDELVLLPPSCLEIHEKMIELEAHLAVRKESDLNRWRLCHKNAVQFFGKTNIKVWLDFIKFERDKGSPKNMSAIYRNAKANLNSNLWESFVFEHTLLHTQF